MKSLSYLKAFTAFISRKRELEDFSAEVQKMTSKESFEYCKNKLYLVEPQFRCAFLNHLSKGKTPDEAFELIYNH